jgi:hypothetical protein
MAAREGRSYHEVRTTQAGADYCDVLAAATFFLLLLQLGMQHRQRGRYDAPVLIKLLLAAATWWL